MVNMKLPGAWEYKTIGQCYKISKGKKVEPTEKDINTIRYIQIDDLRNDNKIKYCMNDSKYVIATEKDILIAWDGANAGTIGYGLSGAIGSTLALLRPVERGLDTSFVGSYLKSKVKYLRDMCTGATIPHIQRKVLDELTIPVPPLEIQKKIVEVLEKAEKALEKRKESNRLLDQLVKSQFIELFGDPIINSKKLPMSPLGEICNMKAGKSIKANDISEFFKDGMYPCYGGNGLRGYVRSYTHEGTIPLIGRQGALCGNAQYAKGKFYATEHAVVTQPKIPMDTCWLYIMLREMNLNRLATGAAQPGLNVSTLVPIEVIVPSIENQKEFSKFVEQVDKLKFEMQKSLEEMENNFNSLMQRAFKGELFN